MKGVRINGKWREENWWVGVRWEGYDEWEYEDEYICG